MQLIEKSFVDEVLARTDIVEIIDSRVSLKKTGMNYQACCPFHEEKTPSFSVQPNKQFYKCFGCGAAGDAIKFLREYDRMSFIDAVRYLAKSAGLQMPGQDTQRSAPNKPYFSARKLEEISMQCWFCFVFQSDLKAKKHLTIANTNIYLRAIKSLRSTVKALCLAECSEQYNQANLVLKNHAELL